MAENPADPATARFLDCEINLATRELLRAGRRQPLEPKVFDLLAYLLEHRDRVVSKDELQDALWGDVVVTEASLDRSIMKARRAVGDDARTQTVIRTIPKRGYRFVAAVPDDAAPPFDPLRIEPAGLSPVHYVRSGDVHIAWRTLGDGPVDLFVAPGFVSHLDMRYRVGPVARFDARLARHGRIIVFDKRGVGLSDRVTEAPTLEQTVADMTAVLDAAGSRRAVLFGVSESGPASALFAATHPDRVSALAVYGSFAKGSRSEDYPWLPTREQYDQWLEYLVSEWGGPASIELFAPSDADNAEVREGWARYLRAAATPAGIRAVLEALRNIDVREVLPRIRVPTVVLHRRDDRLVRYQAGEDFARRIPGARFELLQGDAHWWFMGQTRPIIDAIGGLADMARRAPG